MLKVFIVLFTALISYVMFNRRFSKLQITGICCVITGLLLVGFSNIHSYNAKFAPQPILGNTLVILAQFFLAGMFVYEEKILKEYGVHVFEIVGWEGVWGMLLSMIFLVAFYLIPGHDMGSFENPIQAISQMMHSAPIVISVMCAILVIGPFNYYGTNLTKYSSAMHRCLIDASRMCFVWIISMICGWEHFKFQQFMGYFFVMLGNLIYNEILTFGQKENYSEIKQEDEENKMIVEEQTIKNEEKIMKYDTISAKEEEKPRQSQNKNIFSSILDMFSKKPLKNKQNNEETIDIIDKDNKK